MADIDRVNQLAQAAKMINAFQRVNPADQRHAPKKDLHKDEDHGDKLDLSQDEEQMPSEKPDQAEIVELEPEQTDDSEHLDIAV